MEPAIDSQATQQATQNAFDPRRIGQQNSGFSNQDISDIICLLYPKSEPAYQEIKRIVSSPEYAHYTLARSSADTIDSDPSREDDAQKFDGVLGIGDHALILRLSSPVKDPSQGFTFGRNRERCDIFFDIDTEKRLSNIHFRIFVNEFGCVLLEDQSMNGTVVDGKLLRKRDGAQVWGKRRTLESGSEIKLVMHDSQFDLLFRVRIPRREGEHEDAYARNVKTYLQANAVYDDDDDDDDLNKTIGPGPSGHVNLFSPTKRTALKDHAEAVADLQRPPSRLPREWRGGEKYNRIRVIGKGAFGTVHKVTARMNGRPYAAKELDKREFMKNGVLDQKLETELKIMQKVQHPNIVQYIEHFDWDTHHFIIIMEYVPGGDLRRYIQDNGAIAEQHTKVIADQLVDALDYLHENKITHRDVKPDNILIQTTNPLLVKLTDFGLSKMVDTEQTFLKTFCGTLQYCAPEVYNEYSSYDDYGRRTNRRTHRPVDRERYDHAVDIWSLGGVLFYTLTGSPPFTVSNPTITVFLDHIVKTPLNTLPLTKVGVSADGIDFLSRMIHVRPETRATIPELQSHPWLSHAGCRTDQDFEDDLGQSASHLSLEDRHESQFVLPSMNQFCEPDFDDSTDSESNKENTPGRPRTQRLFGEVSDIGGSGAMPEDRLNLPVSDTDTERCASEVRDSLEDSENSSTPRGLVYPNENAPSVIFKPSHPHNSLSAILEINSQSLVGASSILENLNMKSNTNGDSRVTSSWINGLTTSKRKPDDDTNDDDDTNNFHIMPSIKRLKSNNGIDDLEDEDSLFASIPKMVKTDTGRQIDYPVPKTVYWDGRDKNTWHLDYPEMTHLQHTAFVVAAKTRSEEFGPMSTPLWELAMKFFPPTHPQETRNEDGSIGESSDWDLPSTAPFDMLESQVDSRFNISSFDEEVPSTLTTSTQSRTEIGMFKSTSGSPVTGISIPLQSPILSWGRDKSNTVVYEPATDTRVPKNAFRVVVWSEGYTASVDDFRPWEPMRASSNRTIRASPKPDSYAFYIATKATKGICINANPLQPYEPKDTTAAAICKYWMRLYHGDQIVFWGDKDSQARLTFECSWGGSSATRPADEPPTCVPAPLAQKLDYLWPRALKSHNTLQLQEKAQIDLEIRMRNMLREQERSRIFEQRRLEAIQRLEALSSRETSPADTARTRTNTPARWITPPGRAQNNR